MEFEAGVTSGGGGRYGEGKGCRWGESRFSEGKRRGDSWFKEGRRNCGGDNDDDEGKEGGWRTLGDGSLTMRGTAAVLRCGGGVGSRLFDVLGLEPLEMGS